MLVNTHFNIVMNTIFILKIFVHKHINIVCFHHIVTKYICVHMKFKLRLWYMILSEYTLKTAIVLVDFKQTGLYTIGSDYTLDPLF